MSKPSDLRSARRAAGLSQEALAQRAGVSRRTIVSAEQGARISAASERRIRGAFPKGAVQASFATIPEFGSPPRPTPMTQQPFPSYARQAEPFEPPQTQEVDIHGRVRVVSTRIYNDLPIISPYTDWRNVQAVADALLGFENGQLFQAADIVESMQADDRIRGVISQRIDGLLGLPFELAPPEPGDERATAIADEIKQVWPRIAPDDVIHSLWKWGRFCGYGVAEKIYDTKATLPDGRKGWVPRLKVWHPRYLWWKPEIEDRTPEHPHAGCLILNTRDGPLRIEENDPHWVIYAPYGYYRGWMEGLVRALSIPWLFRQFAYRDWGRFNEVHGMPIRTIMEPADWNDPDKQAAFQSIARLGHEMTVRLPRRKDGDGFDFKLVEAASQSYDAFRLALDQANASIAIALLGQNLTTEVKEGALASTEVHQRVAAGVIRSDNKTICSTLREQVLVEYVALNHGSELVELTPKPGWATDPPDDEGAKATAFNTKAQGIATLRTTQLPFDYAEICKRLDLPIEEGAEIPEFVPPAPPSPFGGKGGGEDEDGSAGDQEDDVKKQNLRARTLAVALRRSLLTARTSRRGRAPLQGQAYADQLVEKGRDAAARLLAGDVRALRTLILEAKPGPDGKVDGDAIKAKLLELYRDMDPSALAGVLGNALLLAKLSGKYSVAKEVTAR